MKYVADMDIGTRSRSGHTSNRATIWGALLLVGATFGYGAMLMLAAVLRGPSRNFTIPYRLAFLAFCILMLAKNRRIIIGNLRQSRLIVAFLVFWGLYGVRLLLDIYIEPVELRLSPLDYIYLSIGGTLIPALAFGAISSSRHLDRILVIFAIFGGIITLLSSWLFRDFIGGSFGRIGMENTDIAIGALNVGYMASALAVIGLFLVIQKRSNLSVLGGAALVSIAFIPLALSASRGPVIAISACLLTHMAARIRTGRLGWPLLIVLGLAGSSTLIFELLKLTGSNLVGRFDLLAENGVDSNLRVTLWIDAWMQFLEKPWLGSGLEENITLFYPHNILIESYMATGIVGGTAFLMFLIGTLRLSHKLLFTRSLCDQAGWIPLLFIHYCVFGMFSGAIYTNVGFWAFGIALISIFNNTSIP